MMRLLTLLGVAIALMAVSCNGQAPPDPMTRERELQKKAHEQQEAEEDAARRRGTDNQSALGRYHGPETRKSKTNTNQQGETRK